jgi:hypothetical protein
VADAMHDDRSAERFSPFRSVAGDEFQAPDQHGSHKTGRRKQIVLIVCAFVAVVLIGASIAAVTTLDNRGAYPILSRAQLEDLAESAGRALEEQAPGFRKNVAVTVETRGATHGISHGGSSPLKWSKGQEFELAALCMGRGNVTVQWQAPGRVTGELPVICSESGEIARTRFTPLADGQLIQFTLMPNDEAVGRAGMAINIIEFQ